MRRPVASIVLVAIGIVLVIMFPVWKWAIAPVLIEIPDDIDVESRYEGNMTVHVDPERFEIYEEGEELEIPITIRRHVTSEPELGTPEVAVMTEEVTVTDDEGNVLQSFEDVYAMDRDSSENVPGNNSNMDREGYYLQFPFGSEKITYMIWDNNIGKTYEVEYQGEEEKDGTRVYHYRGMFQEEPMVAPPAGIPAKLTGAQVKQILGNPDLPLADEEEYPLEFYKSASGDVFVEPITGTPVGLSNIEESYFVNTALVGPPDLLKLSELDYSQTPESISEQVDFAKDNIGLINLATIWVPFIFLIVGLLLILLGLILYRRRRGEIPV